jgi:hypothetical protein
MDANWYAKLAVKRARQLFDAAVESGIDEEDIALEFREEFLTAISWWIEQYIADDRPDFNDDDTIGIGGMGSGN